MKKIFLAAVMTMMVLALNGCGSDVTVSTPTFVTNILSDSAVDGDILKPFIPGANVVTQGMTPTVQSVFSGIDPVTLDEYRAFLHFPLTGANGVPGNAIIASAFLDIFIDSIQPQPLTGTIPIRIDLVDFQPPNLIGSDFERTILLPLATMTISPPISQFDLNRHVIVDVTLLMREAQFRGLLDFQIRILAEGVGVIEINDTTGVNRAALAPLLQVEYF